MGPGVCCCASMSLRSVTPGASIAWRGALTESGHGQVGGHLQVVAVGGHDEVLEFALTRLLARHIPQRLLRVQVLRHKGHGGAAVVHVVAASSMRFMGFTGTTTALARRMP